MPRYKITLDSFIDDRYVKAGEEVETSTVPGEHWEPLDKGAKEAKAKQDAYLEKFFAGKKKDADLAEQAIAVLERVGVPTL